MRVHPRKTGPSKDGRLVIHGISSSVTRQADDEAIPFPTREAAGTREPKRGEYQPSIGVTSARWEVHVSARGSISVPAVALRLRSTKALRKLRTAQQDVGTEVP